MGFVCWQADLLSLALLSYSVQQAFSDCTDLLPIAELQYYCQVCTVTGILTSKEFVEVLPYILGFMYCRLWS